MLLRGLALALLAGCLGVLLNVAPASAQADAGYKPVHPTPSSTTRSPGPAGPADRPATTGEKQITAG